MLATQVLALSFLSKVRRVSLAALEQIAHCMYRSATTGFSERMKCVAEGSSKPSKLYYWSNCWQLIKQPAKVSVF